ncbi:hypothetical protein [Halalkalicoccus jeotgali]|uniref:Uncharacterized protein n=1 Tax=Halalkalicoccus jeotgali (strain DSM 18796 / CECT 7217 / JCM 14584 / KCTC 4019 / B3) TaxID=795797 RepID=D8JD27_HALJB|nr:hypothetical protein [Halalkalicoccus jeotgali]ADJ17180.1 hypothetical protein HacjB3_19213 [Halalkalicoccus jeotgali B3]ELY41166.1 hypothetical protein C497_01972 [Halalkalicoccus jeotgali B3]
MSNPIDTAERKGANILAYAVAMVGVFAVLNGGFLPGGLFLAGAFVLMPRFPLFGELPQFVGWILIAIAFTTLPS